MVGANAREVQQPCCHVEEAGQLLAELLSGSDGEELRRQTEVRFGTRTAQRLFASLQRENDPQRLDAIAEAVVRCETGDELLRQASRGPAASPDA